MKSKYEFDCEGFKFRPLVSSYYSGNMGSGEAIDSGGDVSIEWSEVLPDSTIETFWKFACDKDELVD